MHVAAEVGGHEGERRKGSGGEVRGELGERDVMARARGPEIPVVGRGVVPHRVPARVRHVAGGRHRLLVGLPPRAQLMEQVVGRDRAAGAGVGPAAVVGAGRGGQVVRQGGMEVRVILGREQPVRHERPVDVRRLRAPHDRSVLVILHQDEHDRR